MTERSELNKNWVLKPAFREKLPAGFDLPEDGVKACVPGTVYTDLLNAGLIDDPFYADNENGLQWIADTDWIYETVFQVPEPLKTEQDLYLVFEGLDTATEISLNGQFLGRTANMFRRYVYEISSSLTQNNNKLSLYFKAARPYARQIVRPIKQFPSARHPERVFMRKAQYSFGWDWGPSFPASGIWKPVCLLLCDRIRIDSVRFDTLSLNKESAEVQITVSVTGAGAPGDRITVTLSNSRHTFREQTVLADAKTNVIQMKIADPDLWWPNDLGKPNLYQLETVAADDQNKILDRRIQNAGIRTVELRLKDETRNTFHFVINNRKVFIKGANWIPADSFLTRVQDEDYRYLLTMAAKAHMNMIRVWGGGIYENDPFYDLCDELGLMVWQDFMFACAAYPDDQAFLDEISTEVTETICRLQHHPALAIWCGNNENEWIWHRDRCGKLEEMPGFKIFHKQIPGICKRLDPLRPYRPTTPFGDEPDPNDANSGNRHAWDIWSYWKDYTEVAGDKSLFVTEFGFQAPACLSTLSGVIPSAELLPHSRLFEFHNKQDEGAERLTRFLAGHLPLRTDIEDYIYLTQLNQGFALKTCLEYWRLNAPMTNGTIIWQLNDCWPVTSWSLVDYFKMPKLAYYFVQRAFQQQMVAFRHQGDTVALFLSNQDLQPFSGYVDLHEINLVTGRILTHKRIKADAEPEQNALINLLPVAGPLMQGDHMLIATLYSTSNLRMDRNFFMASRWKYIRSAESTVLLETVPEQADRMQLRSGDGLVLFAGLSHPDLKFDDNAIILLPNEQHLVPVSGNGCDTQEISKIKIHTLNQYLRK